MKDCSTNFSCILAVLSIFSLVEYGRAQTEISCKNTAEHIVSNDITKIGDAFAHGYRHNNVAENINGRDYPTLGIQCVSFGNHTPNWYGSVWVRDLYWGFLGWAQAGDNEVLSRMKTSIQLLVIAKDKNQATGQSKQWPLNDERFYIPQAYTPGPAIAMDFYPWCSESQADFLLMARDYWRLSGDIEFIESIWTDICYVEKTIELMDTNGNSLPDRLWGSYDYLGLGNDTEEPLMCAKTAAAYLAVAELANQLGKESMAARLEKLADKVKNEINKPISQGGLWKSLDNGSGHYVNMRYITKGQERIEDRFIPYENLVPMFFGMTTPEQDRAIFKQLDDNFDKYYNLKYGPMYIAPIVENEKTEVEYSSTPWLGFLDVYLRCKKNRTAHRSQIFKMLMDHAYDVPAGCFTEGLGCHGYLTGNAGRSWDNGNFFHTLVCGIYGLEKSKDGIEIKAPIKMDSVPLTELKNFCWQDAVYDFNWQGQGSKIKKVLLNGKAIAPEKVSVGAGFRLKEKTGTHQVLIELTE